MKEELIKQNSPKAWLLAARPKTLTGCAVPVMIGLALAYTDDQAYYDGTAFSWTAAVLCMLFSFAMQIDANFINDFFDYTRGNDDISTRLGPLRDCPQGCVVFCFLYTTHLSYIGMGDVLVLVFFGIVPVCCTYYVQLHTITWQVFLASVACGLVIDGLLIVNNYRDRYNDEVDGKRTLVVILGADATEWLYLALGCLACLIGLIFWANGHILASILPFIYLLFHTFTWIKMRRINYGRQLNECLGETARNIFIYGLCVTIGLLLL